MTVTEYKEWTAALRQRTPMIPYAVELADGTRFIVNQRFAMGISGTECVAWDSNRRLRIFEIDTIRSITLEPGAILDVDNRKLA